MFSPSAAAEQGIQTRSRRRRQRPKTTDDAEPLPKAKRQRLPLAEQTTQSTAPAPKSSKAQAAVSEMTEVKHHKVAMLDSAPSLASEKLGLSLDTQRRELSMRTKKPKTGERVSKGDGSVVLVTNNAFTVSKLPSLPDRMRAEALDAQCGEIFSSTGYGLSLTHSHALVWPYTSPAPSPETFTFTLPQPSRNPSDPLPLGSLVAPSASTPEPGLVVVMPTTGRITFWESISSAATMDLMRQQRHGVEYTIAGLSSQETAIQITSADPSGFVIAFSSGRLGYMTVRDAHGRPAISFQFLPSNLAPAHSGLFGSIRNVLGRFNGQGDIAAIHSERTTRVGERNITAATSKGKFMAWRFHRGGQNELLNEVDLCDSLISAVHKAIPSAKDFPAESFELFDFTYVPKGLDPKHMDMSRLSDALATDGSTEQHLILLVGLTKRLTTHYCLVEVIMTSTSCNVGMLRPLSSYTTPIGTRSTIRSSRPRIYLPRPALVAFAIFDHSVVVASIANPPESPGAQLHEEVTSAITDMFEDTIDLREESNQEIIGSGFEEISISASQTSIYEEAWTHRSPKPKNPAAVILVRGIGLLRIATNDVDKFASEQAPAVTAKSKLEQTVFFGAKAGTPLVFDGRREVQFCDEQLSDAAVQLSHEILSSTNPHIGTLPIAMSENLASRRQALERLIKHMVANNVKLTRSARWELLWGAEKMLVASLLWARHEDYMAASTSPNKEDTFISRLISYIHEKQKKDINPAVGELDAVRHWFIHDVWRLDLFLAWICESVKIVSKHKLADEEKLTDNLTDATDLYVMSLKASYDFRQANLDDYGLDNEHLDHGVLEDYTGLCEPWTGQKLVCSHLKKLLDMCYRWIKAYGNVPSKPLDKGKQPSAEALAMLYSRLPALTDYYLLSTLEQARFSIENPDSRISSFGASCKKQYEDDKVDRVVPLAHLELWDQSEALARKHNSWQAVAEIIVSHIYALELKRDTVRYSASPAELERIDLGIKEQQARLDSYFDSVGKNFAYAAYDVLLRFEGVAGVLDYRGDHRGYKTQYLRGKGELSRISWINDVQQEHDLSHAATTLLDLGTAREQQVWNKKIELSLGKLALLAKESAAPKAKPTPKALLGYLDYEHTTEQLVLNVDRQLSVIKIQDLLYDLVSSRLHEAIDLTAEVELGMGTFAVNIPRSHKVILQVFESGLRQLLQHEVLDALTLVDLLTLGRYEERKFYPFYLALLVADSALTGEELKQTARLIWRRCLIMDDWSIINATQSRDDQQVLETLAQTQFFITARQSLLNKQEAPTFRPQKPSEVLGVFSTTPDRRFASMERTYQEKLLAAATFEDSLLSTYMEKHRLEHWTHTISLDKQTMLSIDTDALEPLALTSSGLQFDALEIPDTAPSSQQTVFAEEERASMVPETPMRATRSSRRLNGGRV